MSDGYTVPWTEGATPMARAAADGDQEGVPRPIGAAHASQGAPDMVTLTEEHKAVLRSLLSTPFRTPMDEILATADQALANMPTIRQILVFNLPASAFPHNPGSWGDLITSATSDARHLRDILLMFSVIVSDDSLGTPASASIDPNAAHMQGLGGGHGPAAGGGGGPGGPDGAGRGRGGGGGAGRGRGRGRPRRDGHRGGGGGDAGGLGDSAARFDKRGEVADGGNALMFAVGDRRFPKVIPCVEEVTRADSDATLLYRFFFFVFDPQFNFSVAFEKMIAKNAELYGDQRPAIDQSYLQFARIRSTQEFIDLIVIPYLDGGVRGPRVPASQRKAISDRIAKLRDPNFMRTLGLPLSDPRHPANPAIVFSKVIGFSLYLDEANPPQRDPGEYFPMSDATFEPGYNAGMVDEDMDDPDLVVPDEEDDEHGSDAGGDADRQREADDEMVDYLRQRVGRAVSRLYGDEAEAEGDAVGEEGDAGEAGAGATTATDVMNEALNIIRVRPEERAEQDRLSQYLHRLNRSDDASFVAFSQPHLVGRISSDWFGRRLLNLPLLDKIRMLNQQGGQAEFIDHAQSSFTQLEIGELLREEESRLQAENEAREAGRPILPHDESDTAYDDGNFDAPRLRALALRRENSKLNLEDQVKLDDSHVKDVHAFHEMIRNIRAKVMLKRRELFRARAHEEVMQWLSNASKINFRSLSPGDEGHQTYGGFLPETLTQRLSQSEFNTFAASNVILAMRLTNYKEMLVLENRRYASQADREKALYEFRLKATNKFWDVMLHSNNLPPSLRKGMDKFKTYTPKEHWGEHVDCVQNLSSFGNMILLMLSRYNEMFRGSSNQHAFMLATFCHYSSFEYDWGIKPNLLLMGKGSAGKSYIFECIDVLSWDDTVAMWSHTTDRAYSTGTHFSDQTTCMHEAPLSYLGVDKYGESTVADPVLKDRLARQRSSTRSFTKDEQGNRITKDELVMVMGTILMATNEVVPPDDTPLMQRFIVMPVADFKRPDFNVGDESKPLSELVSTTDNKRQIHYAKLFSFYYLILCKMIQAGILPRASENASEMLVKEILSEFTKRTRISTSNPRKRTQVTDVIRLISYAFVVHTCIFTYVSEPYVKAKSAGVPLRALPAPERRQDEDGSEPDAMDLDEPEGETEREQSVVFKAFHPSIFVHEALPRLFVKDEEVVYGLTLLKFMFDTEESYKVLEAFVRGRSGPKHDITAGEAFRLGAIDFRLVPNTLLRTIGGDRTGARFSSRLNRNVQTATHAAGGTATTASREQITEQTVAEDGLLPELSPCLYDPRYIVMTADGTDTLFNTIARMVKHPAPPPIQVQRIFREYSGITYPAHPVSLVLHEINPPSIRETRAAAKRTTRPGGGGAYAPDRIERPSLSISSAPLPRSLSANQLREQQIREQQGRAHQHMILDGEETQQGYDSSRGSVASSDSRTQEGRPADSAAQIGQPLPTQYASDCNAYCIPVYTWMKHRSNDVVWRLDETEPTVDEPVVRIYKDPADISGKKQSVAVLIEYVFKEAHKDALLASIRHVLSNNTMPEGGRNFITALPFVYSRDAMRQDIGDARYKLTSKPSVTITDEDGEKAEDEDGEDDLFGLATSAEGEVMPQFCTVLHIDRQERDSIMKWRLPGTLESHALTHSSIRFSAPDDRESLIQRHFRAYRGMTMDANTTMNFFFALRHFQKVGLDTEKTAWHLPIASYVPEIESENLRALTDMIAAHPASNVVLVREYPRDGVRAVMEARVLEYIDLATETNPETRAKLFPSSSSYYKDMATYDPTTALDVRKREAEGKEFTPSIAYGADRDRARHVAMRALVGAERVMMTSIGKIEQVLVSKTQVTQKESKALIDLHMAEQRAKKKQQRELEAAAVATPLPAPGAELPLIVGAEDDAPPEDEVHHAEGDGLQHTLAMVNPGAARAMQAFFTSLGQSSTTKRARPPEIGPIDKDAPTAKRARGAPPPPRQAPHPPRVPLPAEGLSLRSFGYDTAS